MVRRLPGAALYAFAIACQAAAPDIFVEAEVEPQRVYVQSQALYRLRFFQAVDVREIALTAPPPPLAEFRPLGAERVFEARRDGRHYRVRERVYGLIPYASGVLEIAGGKASGRTAGSAAIELAIPAARLDVRPMPAEVAATAWLPARSVSLTETWVPRLEEAPPGSSLRRTVRVEAHGVNAAQIPEFSGGGVAAGPPRIENRVDGTVLVGVREQSFLLRLGAAGELDVAQLRLPWWNVLSEGPAQASLPAITLGSATVAPAQAEPEPVAAARPWAWAALVLGLLGASVLWRSPLPRARWRLFRASRGNQPAVMRDALLAWAATRWPEATPRSLGALAERIGDASVREALSRIDASLYGRGIDCAPDTLRRAARIRARE